MKVLKRVLIKLFLLFLVVSVAAGAAIGRRGVQQSTPEYAMNRYLSLLLGSEYEKAYDMLDQSEEEPLTKEQYASALDAKKYAIYSSYDLSEMEKRHDSSGNEYVDFQVTLKDSDGAAQVEEVFTVKKQSELKLGIFDEWKIMSGHCMVKNFILTVPGGSEVYLDNKALDASWIQKDIENPSVDRYQIPSLLPLKMTLVIRHPVFESVNTTVDVLEQTADYTGKTALKKSAEDSCKEIGISALKQIYSASATGKTKTLDRELFGESLSAAKKLVSSQAKAFEKDGSVFQTLAVSDYATEMGTPEFSKDESGAVCVDMNLSYRYTLQREVTMDTEEYLEDGTAVQETKNEKASGDNTAKFAMKFVDGSWQISGLDVTVINK